MQSIGEALQGVREGRADRRTGQQVHRYTRTARGREGAFWQPFNRKHGAQLLAAAQKLDRVQRLKHRAERNRRENGAIGHVGMDVLRELLRLVDWRTGRLDPAIATIARRIGRSIAAVVAALKRLRDHGFLEWIRRYVPTGQAGIRGPQVQQTSNAYRLTLPATIVAAMTAPPPEDDTHRRAAAAEAHSEMVATLPIGERMAATIESPGLAATLARIGAALGVQ